MIERKFIQEKMKELKIKEYLQKRLNRVGFSRVEMIRTPFGYKVIIYASRPGLIVVVEVQMFKRLKGYFVTNSN